MAEVTGARARPTKQPGESWQEYGARLKVWRMEQNQAAWDETAGTDWREHIEDARELVGADPPEALARIVARLMASRTMVDAVATARMAQVLGLVRNKSDLEDEERRWAAMSPAERAREMLADPVHGPLIRELCKEGEET